MEETAEETAEETEEDAEDTEDDAAVSGASVEVSSEEDGNIGSTVETETVEDTGTVDVEAGLEGSDGSDGTSQEETPAEDSSEDTASDERAEGAAEDPAGEEFFAGEDGGSEEGEHCAEEIFSPES